MVNILNSDAYVTKFDRHVEELGIDAALKYHVGGVDNYEHIGRLEAALLALLGLSDGHQLVDLGCGSGRLVEQLADRDVTVLGVDVVPKLIDHCRIKYPHHKFEVSQDFSIPAPDNQADIVTAFSLFTHLLHEQTFHYMKDAHRTLRKSGLLVFSFLEYREDGHRKLFLSAAQSAQTERPLIVFNCRESLNFFAQEIGFRNVRFFDGSSKFIQLEDKPFAFGQSVCVMEKR